jgi:hypothetical protein
MEMARQADPKSNINEPYCLDPETMAWLEAFAALVREDERNRTWTPENWTDYERSIAAIEREACEIAIEELLPDADRSDCAEAIRARSGEQK